MTRIARLLALFATLIVAAVPNSAATRPPVETSLRTISTRDGSLATNMTRTAVVSDAPPEVIAPASVIADEQARLTFTVTATDPDGDAISSLTAAGTAISAGATFIAGPGNTSGTFDWTPGQGYAGNYSVTFTASNLLSATATTRVKVGANQAPFLGPIADMVVDEGFTADQAISGLDADGDALTFFKMSGPAFVTVTTVDPGFGQGRGNIHLAPGFADAGSYVAETGVADGWGVSDIKQFHITVENAPISITATADPHGSIAPSGTVPVAYGTSQTFTITHEPCYSIVDVLVDGLSIGPMSEYTFSNVTEGHTISVSFAATTPPPAVPTGLAVQNLGTGTSLKIAWDMTPGATGYEVERSDGFGISQVGTEFEDTGLARGTTYTYRVASVNTCGISQPSPPVSRAPEYYPTLLVHGLCSDHKAFTDCDSEFPCSSPNPKKLGDVLHAAGLTNIFVVDYPNDVHLDIAAETVKRAIDDVLLQTGDSHVNLVAHSQGGLICRYILRDQRYASITRRLVMIGTPNHGSDWARIALLPGNRMPLWARRTLQAISPCLLSSDARYDLQPGSPFLNKLNYEGTSSTPDGQGVRVCPQRNVERQSDVEMWLFHGTSGWCGKGIESLVGLCEPNDGIVETGGGTDGDLVVLGDQYKRTDLTLDPQRNHPQGSHFALSGVFCYVPELEHPSISSATFQVLTSGALPGMTGAVPSEFDQSAEAAGSAGDAEQSTTSKDGSLTIGETRTDTLSVGAGRDIAVAQTGEMNLLYLQIRSPSGRTISAGDSLDPMVEYEAIPILGYQELRIAGAEGGRWLIDSSLPSGASSQQYFLSALERSDAVLAVDLVGETSSGVRALATLSAAGTTLLSEVVHGTLSSGFGEEGDVPFYDDGLHADGASGDGTWGSDLLNPLWVGDAALSVDATALANSSEVRRTETVPVAFQGLGDIALERGDVRVSATSKADSFLVRAVFRNLGTRAIAGAMISLREGPATVFHQETVSLLGGRDTTIVAPWSPSNPDSTDLYVFVDGCCPVLQSTTANDSAHVVVRPVLVGVNVSVTAPTVFAARVYPNPTAGRMNVVFTLPQSSAVHVAVYDVAGRQVCILEDGVLPAGRHLIEWRPVAHGRGALASGIYFWSVRAASDHQGGRIVVIR